MQDKTPHDVNHPRNNMNAAYKSCYALHHCSRLNLLTWIRHAIVHSWIITKPVQLSVRNALMKAFVTFLQMYKVISILHVEYTSDHFNIYFLCIRKFLCKKYCFAHIHFFWWNILSVSCRYVQRKMSFALVNITRTLNCNTQVPVDNFFCPIN